MARSVKMVSDMDTTMMEVEQVDRVGDRLMIKGTMMGSFPADIYIEPQALLGLLLMHLRPAPLSFVFGLPYFWLRCYWRREENRSAPARAKGVALAAGMALAAAGGVVVLLLGLVQLMRLVV
ncbi:MAG: hypothetical protein HY699_00725 [Deltaproteobacteria bacterium]|nr:hypothetical protein [Deltaproteobacteria bacterium]